MPDVTAGVLAIVVLPADGAILDADLAGRPAARYLLDALTACGLRPTLSQSAEQSESCRLVIDGRAWLPQPLVERMLDRLRTSREGFRVIEPDTGAGRMLVVCAPAGVCDEDVTATVSAADLGGASARVMESFADLAQIERVILQGRVLEAMARGVRLRDPDTVRIRGELVCAPGVEIDCDVIFEGVVRLGERVSVGAHCIIRDADIGNGTQIQPFSLIEQSRIGAGGRVGPYGRIRPGCVIGDRVQVGNYVEIKTSRIGTGSRINHHSFIGDAVIADDVTIGAGTITCNHDGTGTNETTIERGAYIGSGCNLIAPVRIGENATIGAGSTITDDVPAGTLTIARARQVTIDGWVRPQSRSPR